MVDLSVDLGNGLRMKNPVMLASGTCGYGEELADFIDLSSLGGISVKGTTLRARQGNASPRMVETPSGMLNAVDLQNKGVDYFVENIYPRIASLDTSLVVNVSGSSVDDYVAVCDRLRPLDRIAAVEINISCPNVKQGGMSFGTDPSMAAAVVVAARQIWSRHLMVKLTPNVTNIVEIARAVEEAGADGLVLINTLLGMRIDLKSGKPLLANTTGGLSGPAVFPVALRMVYQTAKAVNIPVIGMGGVSSAEDVLEMMMAGAAAVEVGAANLVDPFICRDIVRDLPAAMEKYGISKLMK